MRVGSLQGVMEFIGAFGGIELQWSYGICGISKPGDEEVVVGHEDDW